MKRITLILIAMLAICPVVSAGHFSFLGVDINGNIQNFVNQMAQRGFRPSSELSSLDTDVRRWLEGDLIGKDVIMMISATPVTNTVYAISLYTFPDTEEEGKRDWADFVNWVEELYNFDSNYLDGDYNMRYQSDDGAAVITYSYDGEDHITILMIFDILNLNLNTTEGGE